MNLELAKSFCKSQVLFGCDHLIAKENHLMIQKRLINDVNRLWTLFKRQVDIVNIAPMAEPRGWMVGSIEA